jgi:putative addiction module CopG family antidote
MSYRFPPDLQELVAAQLSSGRYDSEDDLLREALRALAEEQEDLTAVRDAVAEWRSGDSGVPLDEAFSRVRRRVEGVEGA